VLDLVGDGAVGHGAGEHLTREGGDRLETGQAIASAGDPDCGRVEQREEAVDVLLPLGPLKFRDPVNEGLDVGRRCIRRRDRGEYCLFADASQRRS